MKNLFTDGLNQIHRARVGLHFAKQNEGDSYNEVNTLVYNFFTSFRALIAPFKANKLFFVMEGYPQFRYDIFSDYKANRIEKSASSENQKVHEAKVIILDVLSHLPVSITKTEHYECDDSIAGLCEHYNAEENENIVLSSDSDYIQLIQEYKNVKIFDPRKKEYMLAPEYHYVCWKALAGDKTDNIPKLMSDKKAQKMALDPNSLTDFLKNQENLDKFARNKELISFKKPKLEEFVFSESKTDYDYVKNKFIELGFESFKQDTRWKTFQQTFEAIQ